PKEVKRAKAGETVNLTPGHYLIVAWLKGADGETIGFHEVFRYVPASGTEMKDAYFHNGWDFVDGVIRLWRIEIPKTDVASGMARFPESADFTLGAWLPKDESKRGSTVASPRRRSMPSFWLDTKEVTNQDYAHLRREHNL